jgi:phage terminase large subunit-like protein
VKLADLTDADLARLSEADAVELLGHLEWLERYESQRLFYRLFPDEDTRQPDGETFHARRKYERHLEHFAAGRTYRERVLLAANRVGKTVAGAYEVSCHLTGEYPDWWEGRRFEHPVRVWAAGKTNETVRDIVQSALCGTIEHDGGRRRFSGTGLIPGHLLGDVSWRQGVADVADIIRVKHKSGALSSLGLKSYQQGRGSFEGTAQHVIWFDEEPPADVYGEALIRTATTQGITILTFTPLEGMSEVVLSFLPQEMRPASLET